VPDPLVITCWAFITRWSFIVFVAEDPLVIHCVHCTRPACDPLSADHSLPDGHWSFNVFTPPDPLVVHCLLGIYYPPVVHCPLVVHYLLIIQYVHHTEPTGRSLCSPRHIRWLTMTVFVRCTKSAGCHGVRYTASTG
jgi:hypothetical protein